MPRNNIQWKLDKSFLAWRAMNCRRNTHFFTYYTSHASTAGRFGGGSGRGKLTREGEGRGKKCFERQDGKISANADCFNCSSAPFMYFTLTPTLRSPRCSRARLFVPSVPSLSSLSRHPFTMILYYSGQFLRVLDGSKEITVGYPIYLLLSGGKEAPWRAPAIVITIKRPVLGGQFLTGIRAGFPLECFASLTFFFFCNEEIHARVG